MQIELLAILLVAIPRIYKDKTKYFQNYKIRHACIKKK